LEKEPTNRSIGDSNTCEVSDVPLTNPPLFYTIKPKSKETGQKTKNISKTSLDYCMSFFSPSLACLIKTVEKWFEQNHAFDL